MNSRYSIFTPYYGSYASQYEEDAIRLLSIIKGLNPEAHITFAQLDGALIRSGLSPRSLYEQAVTGCYTSDMARLDTELGFPAKAVTAENAGGYWQQQLVAMAKRDGKSQEIIDGIDADLDRALAEGLGYYFSKEDVARSIVQISSAYSTPFPSADETMCTMQRIVDEAAVRARGDVLLKMAEPTKPASKAPYYQKSKQKWWK
jgi:hypothetical protein